jgi:hypothetical protein
MGILGFQPRFGTFDAWYVYNYVRREDDPDAFAAVPYSMKGGYKANERLFTAEGLPQPGYLCRSNLPIWTAPSSSSSMSAGSMSGR